MRLNRRMTSREYSEFLQERNTYSRKDAENTKFENILTAIKKLSLKSGTLPSEDRVYNGLVSEGIRAQSNEVEEVYDHILSRRIYRTWVNE